MKKYSSYIITAILAFVIGWGGGVWYAGGKTGTRASPQGAAQQGAFNRGVAAGNGAARQRPGGSFNGGFLGGSVASIDATGMTLTMRDGSSHVVLISSSTAVLKAASGSLSDITVGAEVTVQGSQNADGSVTAQSIQIRPEGVRMMGL